ncbi:MAG: type II toxin-antitoxin system VapC family toxin [Ignavibacteriales bacterium]|nr:type II toxin-antitoxin system VapC family toxin [Ignavibacteriales bacterium]
MATSKVYIETSVFSYLTSRVSKDKVVAAHQLVTAQWWKNESRHYELRASEIVLREAAKGDPHAARKRLLKINECTLLPLTDEVLYIAEYFMAGNIVPKKAAEDILHIAVGTAHGVDFLLSWNCAHIANAEIQRRLSVLARDLKYELPTLCTPLELFRSRR